MGATMNYDELRERLRIDILRIDEELIQLPSLIQSAAESAAESSNDLNQAEHNLAIARAVASSELRNIEDRNGRPPSEAKVVSMIEEDSRVQLARRKVDNAKFQARLHNDLYYSLKDKAKLIVKVTDLIISGYLSPNSAHAYNLETDRRKIQRRSG
jgi:hypothetical protein